MSENSLTPSVYKRGADDGWKLGILMILLFVCAAYSLKVSFLGFFAFALALAVPFLVYAMLRRDYLKYPNMRFFSALWMHGICIFFFGSVIFAAGMYVFLRFIEPDFIIDYLKNSITIYRSLSIPEATQMADLVQQLIDNHMVPSAISFALTSIWSVVFSGSLLSLFLAAVLQILNRNAQK